MKTSILAILFFCLTTQAAPTVSSLMKQLQVELPANSKPYEGYTHKKEACQVWVQSNAQVYKVTIRSPKAERVFFMDAKNSRLSKNYETEFYVGNAADKNFRTWVISETGKRVTYQQTYGEFAEKSYMLQIKAVKPTVWRVSAGVMNAGKQGFGAISCHISAPQ